MRNAIRIVLFDLVTCPPTRADSGAWDFSLFSFFLFFLVSPVPIFWPSPPHPLHVSFWKRRTRQGKNWPHFNPLLLFFFFFFHEGIISSFWVHKQGRVVKVLLVLPFFLFAHFFFFSFHFNQCTLRQRHLVSYILPRYFSTTTFNEKSSFGPLLVFLIAQQQRMCTVFLFF